MKIKLGEIIKKLDSKYEHEKGHMTEDGDTGSCIYYSGNGKKDKMHVTICESYNGPEIDIHILILRTAKIRRQKIYNQLLPLINWDKTKTDSKKDYFDAWMEYSIKTEEDLNKVIEIANIIANINLE